MKARVVTVPRARPFHRPRKTARCRALAANGNKCRSRGLLRGQVLGILCETHFNRALRDGDEHLFNRMKSSGVTFTVRNEIECPSCHAIFDTNTFKVVKP